MPESTGIGKDVLLLILGAAVGLFSTVATKIVEKEYEAKKTRPVVTFDHTWQPLSQPTKRKILYHLVARDGPAIPSTRVEFTTDRKVEISSTDIRAIPVISPPTLEEESHLGSKSHIAYTLTNFRNPQEVIWEIELSSNTPIPENAIGGSVLPSDSNAIVSSNSWATSLRLWLPLSSLALLSVALIAAVVVAVYFFRRSHRSMTELLP